MFFEYDNDYAAHSTLEWLKSVLWSADMSMRHEDRERFQDKYFDSKPTRFPVSQMGWIDFYGIWETDWSVAHDNATKIRLAKFRKF